MSSRICSAIAVALLAGCNSNVSPDPCAGGACAAGDTRVGGDGVMGDPVVPGDALKGDAVAGDPALGDPAMGDSTPQGDAALTGDGFQLPLTTVRVHYDVGFGNSIALRGDGVGMSWTVGTACLWSTGNIWVCELADQTAEVALKPLINDDEQSWARGTNYLVEPGATLDIYPFFTGTAGRIEYHDPVHSTVLDNDRKVAVYLPPSYDENLLKSYPVMIMHDGHNLFEASESAFGVEWEMDETLDALAMSGAIEETILVGPYNTHSRAYELTPTYDGAYGDTGGGDLYIEFLLTELLPFIEQTYRTHRHAGRIGLAGSSFGGLHTLHACWFNSTAFDRCGVFSPSLWWDSKRLFNFIAADPRGKLDLTIYLDSGDSGASNDGMADTAAMRDILLGKGYVSGDDFMYVLGIGHIHNEAAWALRAPAAFAFLLRDPARAAP